MQHLTIEISDIDQLEADRQAYVRDQANKARKLFASVVLAALDDAIVQSRRYGDGEGQIRRWALSRDGREVLHCAGIEPNDRVADGLAAFVANGVRTSVALSSEEQERKLAELAADN